MKLKEYFKNATYHHEPITMCSMTQMGGSLYIQLEDDSSVQIVFGESLFFIPDENKEVMHAFNFSYEHQFSVDKSEYDYYL